MIIPATAAAPFFVLTLASCLGAAAPARAASGLVETPDGADRFYCQERKLGDWFYCAEPNPPEKPESEQHPAAHQRSPQRNNWSWSPTSCVS